MEVSNNDKEVNIEVNTLIDENLTKNEKKQSFLDRFLKTKQNDIELNDLKEKIELKEVVYEEEERVRWDSYTEYFLSIIGFVIDLGNVWR